MRLDREARRTVAQFLNGVAVALVGALALAPMATGTLDAGRAGVALLVSLALHAIAVGIASRAQ